MEMKPVRLLIDEETEFYGDSKMGVTRDFFEFPEFKEDYTDEEVEEFLKEELGDDVELIFVGENIVNFKLKGRDLCFQFFSALKIGNQYYEINKMKRNFTRKI